MISKVGNGLPVRDPNPRPSAPLAQLSAQGFSKTLLASTNIIAAVDKQREDSADAAENGGQPVRDPAPTELRTRAQDAASRRRRSGPKGQAHSSDDKSEAKKLGGRPSTPKPGSARVTDAEQMTQLAKTAMTAPPDLDVAALTRAIQSALGRGDAPVSGRDSGPRLAALGLTRLDSSGPSARKAQSAPTPQNQQGRFAEILQRLESGARQATSFRLLDGTAGPLEVKVAQSGQDLAIRIRALDPSMEGALAASLGEVRRQLRQAGLVPSNGKIVVTQEESSHGFDNERPEQSEPDVRDTASRQRLAHEQLNDRGQESGEG